MNFAQARYQSPIQGRFTSVDPLGASATVLNPQSFNRYTYANNDPANQTDPNGLMAGADQGWSNVTAGFWGSSAGFNDPHFGGPAIIAAANAAYEKNHSDRMEANRINELIKQGLTLEKAKDLIKGNDNLAIEETSVTIREVNDDLQVVRFTSAQLLSKDKEPKVLREAEFEPTGYGTQGATLNVETSSGPAALSGDNFTVRVNFELPKYTKQFATGTADFGSKVILGKDNRYSKRNAVWGCLRVL